MKHLQPDLTQSSDGCLPLQELAASAPELYVRLTANWR
jgi:hypothetical protein